MIITGRKHTHTFDFPSRTPFQPSNLPLTTYGAADLKHYHPFKRYQLSHPQLQMNFSFSWNTPIVPTRVADNNRAHESQSRRVQPLMRLYARTNKSWARVFVFRHLLCLSVRQQRLKKHYLVDVAHR
ncbi:hypothetical protein NPIL_422561 [Nephila pilipes]|uniref:Uncharacterized protein n=1 Tax=Nephila pilipes TaxID=299642 RepID=A0A8X6QKU8_NEPPI|nr:hypothetical protein NPIL_422561 [Nephila pilipes]